jgi:subtilisin-like proprotein convertase family protein
LLYFCEVKYFMTIPKFYYMNRILTNLFFTLVLVVITQRLVAQTTTTYWTETERSSLNIFFEKDREIIPQKAFVFQLDIARLKASLNNAPLRFSTSKKTEPIVSFPTPDGQELLFRVQEAPVFHADLQRQFPQIRSYSGIALNDESVSVRFDISPYTGLSAMILGTENPIFIDAYAKGNTLFYNAYYKKDFVSDKRMECNVSSSLDEPDLNQRSVSGDGFLRKYRLALACTGEYATYHGGTVEKVLAAMNKSMTRVNGVYEKELAMTMEIIPNNTALIFLNSVTDGYTNSSGSKMLSENQLKCDQLIGINNYDIGHVFSTGGGGIADIQSPCRSNKAKGVTGATKPVGDPFDIDYVCHEMGHQYGAQHTFNNSCESNISPGSSYEPGSGSTIMAYAGICSPNVQNNSDAYFHVQSLNQINTYTVTNAGNGCPQKIQTANLNTPVVNAGNDYTIPKNTPFELEGSGSDVETGSNNITFCWEQFDRESATMPPTGTATAGPLFRSLAPSKNAIRIFPSLTNIIKNIKNTWEVLPQNTRTINFRLTVRDNDIVGGRHTSDAMRLTVADAGPFLVTYPDTAKITILGGQSHTIKWNVAGTNTGAINAQQVMILLSKDGGLTYPDTLNKAVANTGTANVFIPETATNKARIKIKAVGNVFFDISNNDFTIEKPLFPSFAFTSNIATTSICALKQDSVVFNVNVNAIAGFNKEVLFQLKGLPSNAKFSLSQNSMIPNGVLKVVIFNLKNINFSNNTITLLGTNDNLKDSLKFNLNVYKNIAGLVPMLRPLAYERTFSKGAAFLWKKIDNAASYTIEISRVANFTTIEETGTTTDTQYVASKLKAAQIYYWRVKAANPCNQVSFSNPLVFQTMDNSCDTLYNETITTIPTTVSETTSMIEVTEKGFLSDVDVYTRIDHTYLADLDVSLESPNGTNVTLFSNLCQDRNNADVTFSDGANLPSCLAASITLKGLAAPKEPLSTINGETIRGKWKLIVKDNKANDGGTIQRWNMRVCTDILADADFKLETDTIKIASGENKNVTDVEWNGTSTLSAPNQIFYKITTLPTQGTLKRGSSTVALGATVSQQEIDGGVLFYKHNENNTNTLDSLTFEATTTKGGWIPKQTIFIKIIQNSLLVEIKKLQEILCYGGTANIQVNAAGGTPPLTYRLNQEPAQSSNIFTQLRAGTYNIEVKDALGLVKTVKLNINEPPVLALNVKANHSTLVLKGQGGTPPYQYNIDNEPFSVIDSFLQLSLGKHTFSVKDANGCIVKDSISLLYNSLIVTIGSVEPRCYGTKTGKIIVIAISQQQPVKYALNNGAFGTNNIFENLEAGSYTVKVQDAGGFERQTELILKSPALLTMKVQAQRDSIIIKVEGGVSPYKYSKDGGQSFQTEALFSKVPNGNYTFVVKDANDCEVTIANYQFVGSKDLATQLGLAIRPNPAKDVVNITFKNTITKNIELQVFNAQGQVLLQNNIIAPADVHTLNISHLPEGIYYIAFKNNEINILSKLMIIK